MGVLAGSANGLVGTWTVVTQDTPGIPGAAEPEDAFGTSVAILPPAGGTRAWLAVGDPMEGLGSRKDAGRVVVIPGAASGLATASARAWHQDSTGIKGAQKSTTTARIVTTPSRCSVLVCPSGAVGADHAGELVASLGRQEGPSERASSYPSRTGRSSQCGGGGGSTRSSWARNLNG